jgi:mono/diheme cytochrome c family protein
MSNRTLAIVAAGLLLTFAACKQETSTETSATTSTTVTTETTATTAADTGTATGTSTMAPTSSPTAVTQTTATGEIQEGARHLGQGLKQGAKDVAVAAGDALQRGGEKLEEVGRKPSAAAPEAPVAASSSAAPAARSAAAAPQTASAVAANGAKIYKAKCVACHGSDASGNTAIGKKNNIPDLRSAKGLPDGQLANLIANGKPGGRFATAHKSIALTHEQIADVIAYIRSL